MKMQPTPIYDALMETPEYEDLEITPTPDPVAPSPEAIANNHDTTPPIPDLDGIIQDTEEEPEPIEDPEGEFHPLVEDGEETIPDHEVLSLEKEEDETLPLEEGTEDEEQKTDTPEISVKNTLPPQGEPHRNLDPSTHETDTPKKTKRRNPLLK